MDTKPAPLPDRTARLAAIDAVTNRGPFRPTWASLLGYRVPRWYEDGKFGIFVHWGPYAVPAFGSEWYPRNMYRPGTPEHAHHRATWGPQERFGYKDFIPLFKAERFDPVAWAELFRAAGARFVVPVAEHHDGFAMYDCSYSRWNAKRMGPQRDVIGELARAVGAAGMVFGASSHRAEHAWFFDGGLTSPSDIADPAGADLYGPVLGGITDINDPVANPPSAAFLDDWLLRTCELVDLYRPQLVWFDWWIQHRAFATHLQRFAAYYYNRAAEWDRGVAINYKYGAMVEGSAVYDLERAQLQGINPRFWQCDTAVAKNSWCHTAQQDYKSATDLVHDLVDIVAKNGALLLNIGPRADGSIPEGDAAILRAIGAWLACNGEAIYGTRPWTVYGEGPACAPVGVAPASHPEGMPPIPAGAVLDHGRQGFSAADIRFTTAGDVLYAIILGVPADGRLVVRSLATDLALHPRPITAVTLLGGGPVTWQRTAAGLDVRCGATQDLRHAIVLRIS